MPTRREFLSHSCGLGVAYATVGSSVLSLGLTRSAAAAHHEEGYKALVCILLAGGNDSYNMLVPHDEDQYTEYRAIRTDLALSRESLLPLPPVESGRTYALHPGMQEVHDMYARGELALLANIGTLLEPVDAKGIEAGTAKIPLGLYSHSDQISQWQTSISYSRSATEGWAGRIADLKGPKLDNGISMNISLSGSNVFQSGIKAVPYAIGRDGSGAPGIYAYGERNDYERFRKEMIDSVLATEHSNLLRNEYRLRLVEAIENQRTFSEALEGTPQISTWFADDYFSQGMRQIARVISARERLGAARQTFFVQIGGWDHHDEVLDNQARMLPIVSKALYSFNAAMKEIGLFDEVVVFTISDFARTLTSNGKGSDHGWGGHHMVMGGPVKGGQTFGTYPHLSQNSPLDTGRGVYVPTTATEPYFAELALWFGVSPGELDSVLPNIREFYAPNSGTAPLGFIL